MEVAIHDIHWQHQCFFLIELIRIWELAQCHGFPGKLHQDTACDVMHYVCAVTRLTIISRLKSSEEWSTSHSLYISYATLITIVILCYHSIFHSNSRNCRYIGSSRLWCLCIQIPWTHVNIKIPHEVESTVARCNRMFDDCRSSPNFMEFQQKEMSSAVQ